MSAIPPNADIAERNCHVRYGPNSEVAASLDHLVGDSKKARLQFQIERASSFQVY